MGSLVFGVLMQFCSQQEAALDQTVQQASNQSTFDNRWLASPKLLWLFLWAVKALFKIHFRWFPALNFQTLLTNWTHPDPGRLARQPRGVLANRQRRSALPEVVWAASHAQEVGGYAQWRDVQEIRKDDGTFLLAEHLREGYKRKLSSRENRFVILGHSCPRT